METRLCRRLISLEDKTLEIIQLKEQKEKWKWRQPRNYGNKKTIYALWEFQKEKRKGQKLKLKAIMAKTFLKVSKRNGHPEKAQRIPNRLNPNRAWIQTLCHRRQRMLKAARGKSCINRNPHKTIRRSLKRNFSGRERI